MKREHLVVIRLPPWDGHFKSPLHSPSPPRFQALSYEYQHKHAMWNIIEENLIKIIFEIFHKYGVNRVENVLKWFIEFRVSLICSFKDKEYLKRYGHFLGKLFHFFMYPNLAFTYRENFLRATWMESVRRSGCKVRYTGVVRKVQTM